MNYAEKTEPLRLLTRQGTVWKWSKVHEEAFNKLKTELESASTLAYYHRDYPIVLTLDASPIGLGAVLAQIQPDGSK